MEERYWLRHPTLHGHVGPYTTAELRAAIESQALPDDSYVLLDEREDELQRQTSTRWRPAWQLLGLEPPATRSSQSSGSIAPAQGDPARERLDDTRTNTSYAGLRKLIQIAKVASLIAVLLVPALGILSGNLEWTVATVVWAVVDVFGVLILAGLAQALLDSADAAMRQLGQHD